jgi:hypothetical protein
MFCVFEMFCVYYKCFMFVLSVLCVLINGVQYLSLCNGAKFFCV